MKIAMQTAGVIDQLGFEKGYAAIANAGFEAIDWGIDNSLTYSKITSATGSADCIFEKELDEILAYYEEELSYMKKYGLTITQAHAPFPCHIPEKPYVFEYLLEIYKKMILFCDKVGCKYLVVHGHSISRNKPEESAEEMDAINDRLYTSLIPTLLQTDVVVCLENLFQTGGADMVSGVCGDPREAVEMIDVYNRIAGKECFGFCLDTGHMNVLSHDPRRYIPVLGHRIKTLHIHDNDGKVDRHKAPYTGNINWKGFYDSLRQIGYEGDLSFETCGQLRPKTPEPELIEPWLTLMAAIGKHFRNKILADGEQA